MMRELKSLLPAPVPFGVDLALPAVGGTARKTNHDYTGGQLGALIEVIVAEGASVFVSAIGVPPAWAVRRLHAAGVVVVNMVGAPAHARRAFEAGADVVCAQGAEGGGHTGQIPTAILVPAVVDVARAYRPRLVRDRLGPGSCGLVVAAGGIYDGRGLAGMLSMGAAGVWVGTRFVASDEAGCSRMHKEAVVTAGWGDTVRTLVVSGRPLRARRNEYIAGWEKREDEVKELCEKGLVPMERDMEEGREVDMPFLMGQVSAVVGEIKPAREIVEGMVTEAVECLRAANEWVEMGKRSRL